MHRRVRGTAVFVNGNVRGCHGEKWVKHYSSDHRILLVGEGDFSFSLSLAVSFGSGSNIVATSRDTLGALIENYKKVKSNLDRLKNLGASVLHGVDATQMQRHESLRMRKFDRIVFNFPHAGFHGREDNPRMIEMHRNLLRGFFSNAIHMLEMDGEVHVTHKTAHPYCLWNIEELASSNSLSLIGSVDFLINDYPGYSNKRGHGASSDHPFPLGECRTFKFMMSCGSRPHIYSYSREAWWIAWEMPPENFVKLNTDGSALGNLGKAGFGGLLRDQFGRWLTGFSGTIGFTNIIVANLQALQYGLQLAWSSGYRNLLVESNSLEAIHLILDSSNGFHPLLPIIKNVRELLGRQWYCSIRHVLREGNRCADFLAKLGFFCDDHWVVWPIPPLGLREILHSDQCSVAFLRT